MVAKRPNSRRNLDMALRRMGGADEEFVRRRTLVANAIVGSLMPAGAVKGGSAMKIRFGDALTRASTDFDAARKEGLDGFLNGLGEMLAEGWEGFEGRIVSREPAHPDDVPAVYVMQPFDVKMSYLGVPWCTVQLELGHNEIGDADEPDMVAPADANAILSALGFPELGPVPTMPLHYQIAQKLHGASEPGSSRVHDLVDLQIIANMGEVDWGGELAKPASASSRTAGGSLGPRSSRRARTGMSCAPPSAGRSTSSPKSSPPSIGQIALSARSPVMRLEGVAQLDDALSRIALGGVGLLAAGGA